VTRNERIIEREHCSESACIREIAQTRVARELRMMKIHHPETFCDPERAMAGHLARVEYQGR